MAKKTTKTTEILEFKVEQGSAISELEKTKKSIISLKEEQATLTKAYKTGAITQEEYAKELVRVENVLKVQQRTYNDLSKSVTDTTSSFDKLKDAIGNTIPGFGAVQGGFNKMIAGAKAFIATPIGAVIAALGLALGALTSYFKGSEEGQNSLNRIMNVGAAVLGKVGDAVRFVGKVIFDNLIKGFQFLNTVLEKTVPGFKSFVSEIEAFLGLDTAQHISDLEEEFILLNRAMILQREVQKKAIAEEKNLIEDRNRSAAQRLISIEKTTKLIKALADEEVRLAKIELKTAIERAKLSDNTREDNDRIAELRAKVFQLETDRENQLKELITKRAEISKQAEAEITFNQANESAKRRANNRFESRELNKETLARTKLRVDLETEAELRLSDQLLRIQNVFQDLSLNSLKNFVEKEKKIEANRIKAKRESNQTTIGLLFDFVNQSARAFSSVESQSRVFAITQLSIDTASTLSSLMRASFKAGTTPIQQALFYATGYAQVIANVKQISKLLGASTNISGGTIFTASGGQQFAINGNVVSPIDPITGQRQQGRVSTGLTNFSNALSTIGGSTLAGAAIGSVVPVVGTVVGAVAGAALGTFKFLGNLLGFAHGGYTGAGGRFEPAGVVHKGEVVWSQADVRAIGGPEVANSLRPTANFANGGIAAVPQQGILTAADIRNIVASMPPVFASWTEARNVARRLEIKESIASRRF